MYASELDTAEGMMRTFNQQVETLSQTFGAVFLPILVKVMPWLTAFVELLGEAIRAVASVFGVEIQKFDPEEFDGIGSIAGDADNATGSINNTTKALKDLKNATLGIDELNVINPQTSSGSGNSGSGAGGGWDRFDIDSIWDESIYNKINEQVDNIKERIKGLIPVVGGIAASFAGWSLLKFLDNLDDVGIKLGKLEPTVKNLAKGLAIAGIVVAVGKLTWDFTGAYLEGGDEADLLKAIGSTVLGAALARFLGGKGSGGITLAISGVVTLTRLGVELNEGTVEISDPEAIATAVFGSISTAIGGALTWKRFGPVITSAVKNLFGGATMASIGSSIGTALSTGWTAITGALSSIPVWGWIAAAVVAFLSLAFVDYDFSEIGEKIGEGLGKAGRWIVDNYNKFSDWTQKLGDKIGNALGAWAEENLVGKNFWELFGFFVFELPADMFSKLLEVGADIVMGIIEGIDEKLKNLGGNIKEFVDGFIKGIKDGFEIKSPSKKMIPIGKEILAGMLQPLSVDGLRDKIKEMWNSAKKWWTGKSGLEKIDIAVKLVKSGWSTVKKWVGSIPALSQLIKLGKSGWSNVKNWIGSIPAVSQGVKLAKSGWSSVKGWIGTIPVMSASIKLIKSGWSTIKNWLGSLDFKLNFKLPKIGINWGSKTFAGFKISYPTGFYTYAKGGFPDMGEMFIAREAGPEMVGRIGSKTTVANNDQIVEAVSEGVYAAVLAAMKASENNGSQSVNVYLDGRQITNAVERRQHERGASLMGKEVFAY